MVTVPERLAATPQRNGLIVGAGIGGLSAAIALRKAGWSVRVFERAASPRELGFGLAIAPNAVAALRELGVVDRVLAQGAVPARGELRTMNGKVLKRAELPPRAFGGTLVMALRPALHGALLEAVGIEAIALGREAVGFTATGDRVSLRFADGGAEEGDLLVGADGTGSVIRRTLHPSEASPRSSGLVAVRGVVHGAVHHLGGLSAVYYLGPGVESMLIRASETGIYWFLSLARELVPNGMEDPAAILALMSPGFDATFRAVTAATDDMRFDALVDRDPIPFWGAGVVTLLGDAAHPVLPQTGQGAAQAMVDAVALGKALTGDVDVERALRTYERGRLEPTARLLKQGRRTARVMKTMNPVACWIRELAVRLVPVAVAARIFTGPSVSETSPRPSSSPTSSTP
jgi:2-polyprenyl-6-methoxyphenol hydroxylase-like FAD-dependent oxidoreductase